MKAMINCSPFRHRLSYYRAWAIACLMIAMTHHRAGAVVIYWDPNGTTSVGGNGTWNTTTAAWSTTSTQSSSLVPWNTADAAGFCAGPTSGVNQGAFTITVNSAITMAGIFNGNLNPGPCTLTISGTGSLNLAPATTCAFANGGTGPPVGSTLINVAITGGATSVLNSQSSGTLGLLGVNTYSGGTLLGGSGPVYFNNNSSFGSGTITWGAASMTISNQAGSGTVNIGNAMSTVAGDTLIVYPNTVSTLIFSGNWTLPTGTETVQAQAAGSATVAITGVIGGAGTLKPAGAGQLSLEGVNTYTGGTLLGQSGIVNFNNASSFSSGTITMSASGGALVAEGTSPITIANAFTAAAVTLNLVGNSGGVTFSGPWNLGANTVTLGSGGTGNLLTISGVISGTGGITKGLNTGSTLTLSGANTYSGKTTIAQGPLSVSSINSVTTPAQQTTSNLGKPSSAANGTLSFGATTSSGTLIYTGAGETTDRVIDLAGTTGGGTIQNDGTGPLVFTGVNTASGVGAKTLTLQGSNTGNNKIGKIVDSTSGATAVTKAGAGAWTLTGANTHSGPTSLGSGGGLLNLGNASALGNGTFTVAGNSSFDNTTGGDLTVANGITCSGGSPTYVGTANNMTFNGAALITGANRTLTVSAKTLTLAGILGDSGQNRNLTKGGNGTLRLSGANTYGGSTTVSAGTLLANNVSGSATGNGTVTVQSGATLGGTGSIAGIVTIQNNGTLAPGDSGIGTLTLSSSPSLAGKVLAEINSGASPNADKLIVNAALTYGGTLTVNNVGPALVGGEVFDLFDATSFVGSFTNPTLPALGSGLNWYLGNLTVNGTLIVNRAPAGSDKNYTRGRGLSLKIAKSDLMAGATDPDAGDSVSYDAITGTGTQGATVTEDATYVYYDPANDNPDTLQFRIIDARGGSATNNINISTVSGTGQAQSISVTGTNATVSFAGIPGINYDVQRSTNLTDWSTLTTTTAPPGGLFDYVDGFSDLGSAPSSAYYRLQAP